LILYPSVVLRGSHGRLLEPVRLEDVFMIVLILLVKHEVIGDISATCTGGIGGSQ
jgi:hypothetical protein